MGKKANQSTSLLHAWKPRTRPLVVLSDQGSPHPISPEIFGVAGRDRSWNPHAENFISANRANLAALEVASELTAGPAKISLRLRPDGVIGAVPLYAPDTRKIAGGVVVQPRFGWNDIGPLLQQIGWSAAPRILEMPLVPGSAREVPPWVLAGPILKRLGRLIREVRRGFRMHEEVRQSPRGQILWPRYITQQVARGAFHELPCRFPELGPDLLLQGYLRWGVERVQCSLAPYASIDLIARQLAHEAEGLLFELRHARARVPDHHALGQLMRLEGLPSEFLRVGLQALGWLVDERGIAGTAETDGLSWSMPMHQLFERWVEHLARCWAHQFGGQLRSAHAGETSVPLVWERGSRSSLSSLAPDIVIRSSDQVFIIDAKYKGHFEELDDRRWAEVSDQLREEHRHDLHQVLAYAALYDTPNITSMLVYPMQAATWQRLAERNRTTTLASVCHCGRNLTLVLSGIPLKIPGGVLPQAMIEPWNRLQDAKLLGRPIA